MIDKSPSAEQVVIEVMRHFGFRRNYQVAEYFEVTPQTLSGWIKSGEIPPKHLIKYTSEVLQSQEKADQQTNTNINSSKYVENRKEILASKHFFWNRTKMIFRKNLRIVSGLPIILTLLAILYVFVIAQQCTPQSPKFYQFQMMEIVLIVLLA